VPPGISGSPDCDQILFIVFKLCLPALERIGRVGDKVESKGVTFFDGFVLGGPGACDAGSAFIDYQGNPGGVGVGDFFVDVLLEIYFRRVVEQVAGSKEKADKQEKSW
jgi:hypothetical protein